MPSDETTLSPMPAGWLNPGGRLSAVAQPGDARGSSEAFWAELSSDRLSPVMIAAMPILALCGRLKDSAALADPASLRERVLREIDAFERRIVPIGLAPRSVRAARYALCATIDDIVLNTPWGSRSIWTTRSMVSSLFSETWGGDRFFDLLTQLKRDPAVHVDLLELLYYCLSLGFVGRLRVEARGATELATLREDLQRLIRAARGNFERDLSPHWRGTPAARRLRGAVPAWLVALLTLGSLALAYSAFLFLLNARSDIAFAELAVLPPHGAVGLARAAPPPPPPPMRASEGLRRFLEPEIRAGLVTVSENAQSIGVTIRNTGIFASGNAMVAREFESLFQRIGNALNDQAGAVLITGHTDAQPIRTVAFPSNFHLSRARAEAAALIIGRQLREPDRLRTEGVGDSVPVAPNDSEDGRQRNRRIEIVIDKPS